MDTSVWIDHFRGIDAQLVDLLNQNRVLMHPMILGEMACGCLHNRSQLLALLRNLPGIIDASHDEALFCLEQYKIMGKGIGFIDLHLLAATFFECRYFALDAG